MVAALPRGDADAVGYSEPVFVRPPRRLLALGALAFACLLIEGASADWSAVYLRDELGTTAAIAAIGFTAFSITMTLGRVFGDRLVDRFGPEAVVRGGGGVAAGRLRPRARRRGAGARDRRLRLPGRRDVGRRADRLPRRGARAGHAAGVGLAAVSSTGYLGFLVGPPTIGGLAEAVGLPAALGWSPPRRSSSPCWRPPPATRAPAPAVAREPQTVAA